MSGSEDTKSRRVNPSTNNENSPLAKPLRNIGKPRCKKSNADGTKSRQEELWGNDRKPRWRKSRVNISKAVHAKPCEKSEKAKWALSTTGRTKTGSRQTRPKTSAVEPRHAQLLDKKNKPRWRKSKVDMARSKRLADCSKSGDPASVLSVADSKDTNPTRDSPRGKNVDSSCARECGNILKPKCRKSRTDVMKSKRAGLLVESVRPRLTKSDININNSMQDMPQTEGMLSGLARLWSNIVRSTLA